MVGCVSNGACSAGRWQQNEGMRACMIAAEKYAKDWCSGCSQKSCKAATNNEAAENVMGNSDYVEGRAQRRCRELVMACVERLGKLRIWRGRVAV